METVSFHARVEVAFTAWGYFIVRWRWPAILVSILCTGVLASHLPDIQIDNSTESFLHPDDPSRLRYDDFRDQFGQDEQLVIAIKPSELFELGFGLTQPKRQDLSTEYQQR